MAATGARGLALAVIDGGRIVHVAAFGARNAAGAPLQTDTVMYGASLTKAAFAYMVLQLVDEGRLDLDTPIATYLPKPLPSYDSPDIEDRYARYTDLKNDDRWMRLTPRRLLTHASGFANFGFLEPDGRLQFHFEPGTRYAYSGDGIILLQFIIEQGRPEQRLGLDVGAEMNRRLFAPLGMTRTSLIWRPDFAANLADGWDIDGKPTPHDERSRVRAAGSMDTTIDDIARLAAAVIKGELLAPALREAFASPHLPITTASQFPTLQPELPAAQRRTDLAAGLGVITYTGPQGRVFFKGGHDDITANFWICVEASRRCVVVLANDVRAEAAFPDLVDFVLGDTRAPWSWEYPQSPVGQSPVGQSPVGQLPVSQSPVGQSPVTGRQ